MRTLHKIYMIVFLGMFVMLPSLPAHAVCSNNEDGNPGEAGEIEYFTATNELMYCDDTDWVLMTTPIIEADNSTDFDAVIQFFVNAYDEFRAALANQFFKNGGDEFFVSLANQFFAQNPETEYTANAVTFDGTNDYLSHTSAFAGVTDGKQITVSFWARFETYPSATFQILGSQPGRASISYSGNGTETMQLVLRDTSNVLNTNVGCGPDPHVAGVWYHHLISVDTSTGTANCYVDDADSMQTFTAPTDATLDFDMTSWAIGSTHSGNSKLDGQIADLWIDFGTYIDFSIEANRRKFISAAGYPVNLGANGSIPTGSTPDIFLSGDTATWHTNDGTGGGFTETGALTDGSPVTPNGLTGHWELDEGSGTSVIDSSATGNNGTLSGTLPTYANGVKGTALDFPGSTINSHVSLSQALDFNATEPFTIAAWVYPESIPSVNRTFDILSSGVNDNTNPCNRHMNFSLGDNGSGSALNPVVRSYAPASTEMSSGTNLSTNQWQHVTYVYDGTNMNFYIDGTFIDAVAYVTPRNNTDTADCPYSSSTGQIGGFPLASGNRTFNGKIDDVRVYKRELSATEISDLYDLNKDRIDLVGHWKLDETTTTTTASDSSPMGNDGTYNNWSSGASTGTRDGVIDTAISFDGTQDYIDVPNTFSFPSFTACAWINLRSNATRSAFISNFENTANGWWVEYNGGNIRVIDDIGSPGTDDILYATAINEREWVHFCAGIDNTPRNFLYINGSLIGNSDTPTGSWDDISSTELFIGQRGNNTMWVDGMMDDVRVYNRALSGAEILELYNNANSALVGHWKLDETSGTAVAADSSNYGNNGTYTLDNSRYEQDGIIDNAISTENNEFIEVPHDSSFGNLDKLTLTGWAYPTGSGSGYLIYKSDDYSISSGSSNNRIIFTANRWNASIGRWRTNDDAIIDGQWNHIAITYDYSDTSNDPLLFVNGQSVAFTNETSTPSGSLLSSTENLFIGNTDSPLSSTDWSEPFDDIRIYNKILSATEIAELATKPNEALIGHWKLDETSGTTAADSSQYGNDGTLTNSNFTTDSVDAPYDTGFYANGTDSYISIPDPASSILDFGAGSFSYGAWFKGALTDGQLLSKQTSANAAGYSIGSSFSGTPGQTWCRLGDGSGNISAIDAGNTAADGAWHHIMCVADRSTDTLYIYVNGISAASADISSIDSVSSSTPLQFGARNGANFVEAEIDDVRVYSRALNASEVLELYNNANSALVGHWKLDETSGTVAADSSQYGNDGTVSGTNFSLSSAEGIVDNAFTSFDISDLITVSDNPAINPRQEITVSAWVRSRTTNRQRLIEKWDGSNDYMLWIEGTANGSTTARFEVGTSSGSSFATGSIPVGNENEWFHLTGTYDGSNVRIYVNATLDGSNSRTGTLNDGSNDLIIGNGIGGSFNGDIDDVRIYNKALTAAEILELYNKPNEALVGHWKLDETSGTTAADSSIYGNDGTMNGGLDASNDSADGVYETSLDFDNDDYISIPNNSLYNLVNSYTIASWFKIDEENPVHGSHTIIAKGINGPGYFLNYSMDFNEPENSLRCSYTHSSGAFRATPQINDSLVHGQWHHGACVLDPLTEILTAYVDGVQIAQYDTSADDITPAPQDLMIGRRSTSAGGTEYTRGKIDDVRIYNRALDATEIQALYDESNGALIGHWKLDETSGTTAVDSSSQGNDGTMINGLDAGSDSVDGIIETALTFDETAREAIEISGTDFDTPRNLTIAGWANLDSFDNSGSTMVNLVYRARVEFRPTYIEGSYESAGVVQNRTQYTYDMANAGWTHIAYTINDDDDEQQLFVNGVLVDTDTYTPSIDWGSGTTSRIGRHMNNTSNFDFDGELDDIRIYNKALSATEVQELYANSLGGLVAHYRLDETSGTTAFDSSPAGNDGTMNGGLDASNDRVDGPVNTALDFDGVDDYIDGIPSASGELGTQNSFAYWVKLDAYPPAMHSGFGKAGENTRGVVILPDGDLRYSVAGTSGTTITPPPTINFTQWTHLAYVRNEQNIRFYANGVFIGEGAMGGNENTRIDLFGRRSTGGGQQYLDGKADDIRVYNRALSDSEIQAIFDAGDPPTGAADLNDGLLAYYKLDETSGTAAADSSGSGYDGTHSNATPAWQPTGGKVDGALGFTPSSDHIDAGNWEITGGDGGFTLSAWVFKDVIDVEDRRIISKAFGSGINQHRWALLNNGGNSINLRMETVNGFENNSIGVPNDIFYNKWSLLTVTYDAATGNIIYYINGEQYGTDTHSLGGAVHFSSGDLIAIGNNPAGAAPNSNRSWSGSLDEVRVYNRPLTPSEVEVLAACTGPGSFYYNFSDDVMQWCNDVAAAQNMGPENPPNGTAPEGRMLYQASEDTMYYYNPSQAIPIGKACIECGGSPTKKVAFVTARGTQPYLIGGIPGGDAFCQSAAEQAGLEGTYYVWLADSDPSSAPATRFSADIKSDAYEIVKTDGVTVANDWTDLTDGTLLSSISITEYANISQSGSVGNIMSNVNTDGTQFAATNTCNDWTGNPGGNTPRRGHGLQTGAGWTNVGTMSCLNGGHLYCFEQ